MLLDDTAPQDEAPTTHYAASGIRKTVFALTLLLLLPFYGSLPAMLYQRLSQGVWLDTWGLFVIALAFTVLMALILFELIYALRAEIILGETTMRLVLPKGAAGAVPMLSYRGETIAYQDIASVETRSEVYGGSITPVMMKSTWLRLKDDRLILLGAVNDRCTDHVFPFDTIARQIAQRAGLAVINRGLVKRQVRDAMLGLRPEEPEGTALAPEVAQELNSRHRSMVFALISVFASILALGLTLDILAGSTDLGERQPNSRPVWSRLL